MNWIIDTAFEHVLEADPDLITGDAEHTAKAAFCYGLSMLLQMQAHLPPESGGRTNVASVAWLQNALACELNEIAPDLEAETRKITEGMF